MARTLAWMPGYEGRICLVTLTGDMSVEELITLNDEITAYLHQGTPPVHVYIDIFKMGRPVTRVTPIKSAMKFISDPALGWVLVVGGNAFLNVIVSVLTQITGTRSRALATHEAAMALLMQEDSTLVSP